MSFFNYSLPGTFIGIFSIYAGAFDFGTKNLMLLWWHTPYSDIWGVLVTQIKINKFSLLLIGIWRDSALICVVKQKIKKSAKEQKRRLFTITIRHWHATFIYLGPRPTRALLTINSNNIGSICWEEHAAVNEYF